MAITSTVFERSCLFINGVGGCTTIVGAPSRGAHINTSTVSPVTTSSPTASTSTSSALSPTPNSASPSQTPSSPSSTPPSTSLTAVGTAISYSIPSSPPTLSNGPLSPPETLSQGNINTTSTIASLSHPKTTTPITSTSDTSTPVADTLSAASPTVCSILNSSPIAASPLSSRSTSRLPEGAIVAIGISIAGILLVLSFGLIWYAARRGRRPPTVVISSTSMESNGNVSLSEATLAAPTPVLRALLPIEDESEKLESTPRNSFALPDGSGPTVAHTSNFEPLFRGRDRSPLFRFLETVPFLAGPFVSAKGPRGAVTTHTATTTIPNCSTPSTEGTEGSRPSAPEMEGGSRRNYDPREDDGHHGEEDGSGSAGAGGAFRYETDGGIRLDGGPLYELPYVYVDDDQCTIATIVTPPPPYSRY